MLCIDKSTFSFKDVEKVDLCDINDRIGQIAWLVHKKTHKSVIVSNTHLSFPHNEFDKQNQLQQIRKLDEAIKLFSLRRNIMNTARIIAGDLNVEAASDVCDLLRRSGFVSCLDQAPPSNGTAPPPQGFPLFHRSSFISHRNHLQVFLFCTIFVFRYDRTRSEDNRRVLFLSLYAFMFICLCSIDLLLRILSFFFLIFIYMQS